MVSKTVVTNVLLVGAYGVVAVALTAVWRMPLPGDAATFLEPPEDRRWIAASGDAQVEGDPLPTQCGDNRPRQETAPPDAVAPGTKTLPLKTVASWSSGRRLVLPESPPAADPVVAQRQQRISLGDGASLAGFRPFPDDNPWNRDVSQDPVDPRSEVLLRSIGWEAGLHPCFGRGEPGGERNGIPYVVVSSAQPRAPIEFVAYPEESDPGPYPIPSGAPVEGEPGYDGDRHVLVIDRDEWKLYELFRAFEVGGRWRADSGAVWDLSTNHSRPLGYTSADAAGLPVFPGLVRYDEVAAGEIRHALRFTAARTRRAFVPPASHWASSDRSPLLPPMGMRVRLKADYDLSGFPEDVRVILQCLKTYGMILADNGSDWFITGAPDERWNDDALRALKRVRGKDLEVLRMDGLVAD